MNVVKLNEHTEDYLIRRPSDANFLFEVEDKQYIYVGDKFFSLETSDTMLNYSSELGFNDNKNPFAYDEQDIYFMLLQKSFTILEYKKSTEKN